MEGGNHEEDVDRQSERQEEPPKFTLGIPDLESRSPRTRCAAISMQRGRRRQPIRPRGSPSAGGDSRSTEFLEFAVIVVFIHALPRGAYQSSLAE